jgi:prolyl oligopeptidase
MKLLILFISISLMVISCQTQSIDFKYPKTQKTEIKDDYFGETVKDPYRWLEEEGSENVNNWIHAQNKVTNDYLKSIPYRDAIRKRLNELWRFSKSSAPFKKGKYYFQYKNNGEQNHDVLYIKKNLADKGRIILDPNKLSKDGTSSCQKVEISKDSKYLAFSLSKSGSDWNDIYIINIDSGKLLDEKIERVKFSEITWYKDGFFYSGYGLSDENSLTKSNSKQKVYYHKLNTKQENDELIFEMDGEPNMLYETHITSNEKYLVISYTKSTSGNGLLYKEIGKKDSKFKTLFSYNINDYIFVGDKNGKFLIKTNDNAQNYKLIEVEPGKNNPITKDIIPEKEIVLEQCKVSSKHIVAIYLKDAYHIIRIYTNGGIYAYDIELPGKGTITNFNTSRDSDVAYYSYTSFAIPEISFSYNFADKKTHVISKPKLKYRPSQYITEQVFFKSKDGTKIPMFITRKKTTKLDGNNPCLLYGYGGFNISLTPSFNPRNILWLESGGIYAVANLRGGGEYGSNWHKAGTKMQKQNVFDDFIEAAKFLIKKKYTDKKRLAIHGGSNGGLLVGAVTNQRPDLFRVSLPAVGVMDMLRYHKFTIGYAWAEDYGTSDENKDMFQYLKGYSPVHTVNKNTKFPAILVTTADHDDRVVPAHSFKYISELQAKNISKYPTMIRIEKKAGHGAGMPISKQIDLYTDIWAFTFYNMGLEYPRRK